MRCVLLFLILVACVSGNIPPCSTEADSTQFEPFSIRFLNTCDVWQAPHLINPMLLMAWSKSWVAALLISGLFEVLEVIGVAILHNYVVFIGVTNVGFENIVDIVLSDWVIQATFGILLGAWLIWFWSPPTLWYGWRKARGHFMMWLGWYLFFALPQIAFAFRVGNVPDGFPLGSVITVIVQSFIFAFLVQNEPNKEYIWRGRSERDRIHFWIGFLMIYYSFYLVVQFDFFYGSAPQTWLLWGFWMIAIGVWSILADGRGKEMLLLWDWMGSYARRINTSPKPEPITSTASV